jgi:glucose-6-phosphate 1-dehydrogenase
MARRRKEAIVRFRPVPRLPFGGEAVPPANELRIGLDGPYGFALRLTGAAAGPPTRLAPLVLDAELPTSELPAYSRVLMDVLSGDSALSIRGDEAEQAWRVLTPVLDAWAEDRVPMLDYPAGSDGPPPLED